VRDNTVKGELDKAKFTELVHSLQAEHSIDGELTSSLLGFDSARDMYKHMVSEGKKKNLEDNASLDKSRTELKILDDLSLVLNTLFTRHGHTLPYGYIAFLWGGKISVMVEMDDALKAVMERVSQMATDRKVDISIVLAALLKDGLGDTPEVAALAEGRSRQEYDAGNVLSDGTVVEEAGVGQEG
jgi:hypothetical protein